MAIQNEKVCKVWKYFLGFFSSFFCFYLKPVWMQVYCQTDNASYFSHSCEGVTLCSSIHSTNKYPLGSLNGALGLLDWNMMMRKKKSSLWSWGMSAQLCCQRQCRTDSQALAPPQRAQPHLCVRDPGDVIGPGDAVLGRGAGKALFDVSVGVLVHTHTCCGSLLSESGSTSAVYMSQPTADELLAAPLCLHELWKHLFPPSLLLSLLLQNLQVCAYVFKPLNQLKSA